MERAGVPSWRAHATPATCSGVRLLLEVVALAESREGIARFLPGYCAIGIEHTKTEYNVGTLWRSAHILGASFIFTVGRRYKPQVSDTTSVWKRLPLFDFADLADLWRHLPFDCRVVGIELEDRAVPLQEHFHWPRAVYLLGAEDHGLTSEARRRCHDLVQLPGAYSLNVAVAGSIVLYDRLVRGVRPRFRGELVEP